MLARAAIAGFVVGVIGLAVVAGRSSDSSPSRLPAIALGGESAGIRTASAALSFPVDAIEYRVRGTLPDLPGRARAWEVGRDGDASRVEALAHALGLDGPVKAGAGGWTVSASGHSLRVERQPGLPWYFGPDARAIGPCTVPATAAGASPAPDTPVAGSECGLSGGGVVRSAGSADARTASRPVPLSGPFASGVTGGSRTSADISEPLPSWVGVVWVGSGDAGEPACGAADGVCGCRSVIPAPCPTP